MKYALLDNSGFAGFMRLYLPEKETHLEFNSNFPEHKYIDYVSAAQLLTAICIYEQVWVEGSSDGHYDSAIEIIPSDASVPRRDFSSSWVTEMCHELPSDLSKIIVSQRLWTHNDWSLGDRAKLLAFDLYNSFLKDCQGNNKTFKIPNVYTSPTYKDRQVFVDLNEKNGSPLSESELQMAMFLHRGILLSALTSKICDATYLPYSYRGQLLASLPPGVSYRVLNKEHSPRIYSDATPDERQLLQLVNKAYYEVLGQFTWTQYDNFIPFVGASILSRANYNIYDALEIALEYRLSSNLSATINELYEWKNDKVMFEYYLEQFKQELDTAGTRFKLDTSFDSIESTASLTVFWLPFGLKDPILEALKLLPDKFIANINAFLSKVKRLEGHQMLLIDHVTALNEIKSSIG